MHYTPIELKIIQLLADGLPHPRAEVLRSLDNPTADYNCLWVHIFHLRQKVRIRGQDILTELRSGGTHLRHVILLSGKDPGGLDPL